MYLLFVGCDNTPGPAGYQGKFNDLEEAKKKGHELVTLNEGRQVPNIYPDLDYTDEDAELLLAQILETNTGIIHSLIRPESNEWTPELIPTY